MATVIGKSTLARRNPPAPERIGVDEWGYPTGMVWCPMKMSGMALMKCAEMQKQLGCGSLKQFKLLTASKPGSVPICWPWLRRSHECSARAGEKELRELRVALSPLKVVKKGRKSPSVCQCPRCGGRKAFAARQCRRCWLCAVEK